MPEEKDTRLRVGFLTTELGVGGAEKVVFELARRLDRERFDVVGVWCLKPADGYYAGELSRFSIPFESAGIRGPADVPFKLRRLRRHLAAARLDLLNAHLFHASVAGRLASRAAGVRRLVVTHHFREKRWWRHMAERMLQRSPDAATAVSSGVAALVSSGLHLPLNSIRVIPNGVDVATIGEKVAGGRAEGRRRLRVPEGARLVGTVGRLTPEKDPLTLLEAFALLAREDDSLRLMYVGDGPLHEKVFKRIGVLGLRDRASIVGFLPDVPGALAAMDFFALASRIEGHPLALLEAMAAGLPAAATDIAAVREILDGREGVMATCPPGKPELLAEALRKLLTDSDLAAAQASAARELVSEKFTVQRMVRDYEALFEELVANGSEAGK
ncbi:MAG: glycosyltransferase [Planctomycetota bacterium]|jgi:glycosyltransferase involved in cell wall biosynthesis